MQNKHRFMQRAKTENDFCKKRKILGQTCKEPVDLSKHTWGQLEECRAEFHSAGLG